MRRTLGASFLALAGLLCWSSLSPALAESRFGRFDYSAFTQAQSSFGQARYQAPSRGDRRVNPMFMRQVVQFRTGDAPGSIVVDTQRHFLYLVLGDGTALRYGIGVAKSGFEWSGTHSISNKREWPDWTPPAEMLQRRPELPRHMEGGLDNPLGARALYIGSTLYRIHGTNEPWTIGQDVSSGCIRMTNDDVVDLYSRVKIGAKVVVL